jgi:Na+-driven multidrug efflux pump
MASLFTGQAVLVARFAGAGDHDKVNRVVYQAFITAIGMFAVLAPIGYFSAPYLLTLVNAAPEVRAQALPLLRINFVFSIGMLVFFMLSAALRAAGDARTPLRLGITMTVLNLVLNLLLIPRFGTAGSAMGTAIASLSVSAYALWLLFGGKLVIRFTRDLCTRPDWTVIRSLFTTDLATALDDNPEARANWDGFSPSARKLMLWWVISAARQNTRGDRIIRIVDDAALGRRARN